MSEDRPEIAVTAPALNDSPSPSGPPWHVMSADTVASGLKSDPDDGLFPDEAARRLRAYGPNAMRKSYAVPWWRVLASQFRNLVVLLLVAAAAISLFWLHDILEGISIIVVILLNAGIGFTMEYRAAKAMEALQRLGAQDAVVVRGGGRRTVPASDIVPGDLLVLQEGQAVPADARVLESAGLLVDEASLTGESVPVVKRPEELDDAETPLADRVNMVYKGTSVSSGNGRALVVATGMETELGRVSELVSGVEDEETPLERRLANMAGWLILFCLAAATVVLVSGLIQGIEFSLMLEAAIALAVAAVPEGLPAVATIALAVGMQRMAKRNALIRRLPAVETLGSATCVCTDKTGTLTRSEMVVTRVALGDRLIEVTGGGYSLEGTIVEDGRELDPETDRQLRSLVTVAALCNNAEVSRDERGEWHVTGDPTEAALVVLAGKAGRDAAQTQAEHDEVKEFPFSSETMLMGTVNRGLTEEMAPGDGSVLSVKGAPAKLVGRCKRVLTPDGIEDMDEGRRRDILDRNEALAADGLRMLGLAFEPVDHVPADEGEAYRDLIWIGLTGLMDPPRPEVRETVDLLTRASIKTVMITGDQAATASNIAADLHIAPEDAPVISGRELQQLSAEELAQRLDDVEVFARVNPEQKVKILEALQARGEICAMLGDGVNDAIALKKADIGVAMGIRGTDVAKETADMLLLDDSFVTVGAAVRQGRIIYANIKKFIHYLFSCNLSEICVMLFASLLGQPLPLLPLQILWLNIVTDVFPALSLAVEPGEKNVMEVPPRPADAALLDARTVKSISGYAVMIAVSALAAYLLGRFLQGYTEPSERGAVDGAVTMSFMTIALAQLFHVFNSRKERAALRLREWFANRYVLGAVVLTVVLQLAAVYMPGLKTVLKTAPLRVGDWLIVLACSLVPLVVGQMYRRVRVGYESAAGA